MIALVIFILILFGSDALFSFALKYNANIKTDYISLRKIDAKVLYLGPCEAEWVMDPAKIDPRTGLQSYNLGESHSDFADNFLHLYLYLKHNPAPQYLFLYVTGESIDRRFNVFNTFQFANFLSDSTVSAVVRENDRGYYRWSWIPFLRYAYYNSRIDFNAAEGFRYYLKHRSLPAIGVNGFIQPDFPVWNNHVLDFMRLYPMGTRFAWNSLRKKYLEKTIALAQQHHIKIYLYESPVWNPSLPYILNRSEVITQIRNLAAFYQVPYLVFDTLKMSNDRLNFVSNLYTSHKGGLIFDSAFADYFNRYIHAPDSADQH